MCTNSARLVNSLECYMDDLVDCFEDFVKKSLLIISIAVGALIVMLGYVLKIVTERSQPPQMGLQGSAMGPTVTQVSRASFQDLKSRSSTLPDRPCTRRDCRRTTSASANTGPLSSTPSFDEKVLRNIGLSSCSKNCVGKRSIMRNSSSSRVAIPSMPTCIPNHHLSTPRQCSKLITSRNSCCSMCCADDDRL